MNNYLIFKYLTLLLKEYIFIFLISLILVSIPLNKSFGEENVFTINSVKVKGPININFSRDKYINRAFIKSFDILMEKILLSSDLKNVQNRKLKDVKKLINSFQIKEESYRKGEYTSEIKIFFNENKVKDYLREKNISFSLSENINAIFYPVLFIDNEIQSFEENFFYKQWTEVKIKNEFINFILPIEDLDDLFKITKMKDNIEDLDIDNFVKKYDVRNYTFVLMDYSSPKLKIYLKTNFNKNKISKNISYELKKINDTQALNNILVDLKLKITDLWKEENSINLLMPLRINIKFEHINLSNLDEVKNVFYKIGMIDSFKLEEFDVKNSFFTIFYYGNPKKLNSELSTFGYNLNNNKGSWELYKNE